ncbi:Phosphatase YbjI [Corynebacterium kutscheri]|uniref:HAD family hydrolase n=1 Tax=Corynebacterium kutscheri TaxID=35755 RepID=UPI000F707105|nr:HAD family hydrolase [Corynebacterium kutscheri]VEH80222.1 Phosphatase YbjI [Corynebacterium kutscheri]
MDYRLVVSDMDGTLLNNDHAIPDSFWPLLDELHLRGITFAPASGRQLFTLQEQFSRAKNISFIAENGTVVYHQGKIISLTALDKECVIKLLDTFYAHPDMEWGLILCRADGAYIQHNDSAFLTEYTRYYAKLTAVEDLYSMVNDEVIKIAIYSVPDAETAAYPLFAQSAQQVNISVSGAHWIDVMNPNANKGIALQQLAQAMDIPITQTLAFGDFLNDLELIQTAGTSYAMDNAHPHIKEIADFIAPSNAEEGVITTLHSLIQEK